MNHSLNDRISFYRKISFLNFYTCCSIILNSRKIITNDSVINGELLTEWGDRNSYRMSPYHRMDVSLTLKNKEEKKYDSSWSLSIYNIYNRQNPYFIYFEAEGLLGGGEEVQINAQQVSLFPIIPSISWNFKF